MKRKDETGQKRRMPNASREDNMEPELKKLSEDWKTCVEVADWFHVTRIAVLHWRQAGCPYKKTFKGRKPYLFFRLAEVTDWLEKQRNKPRKPPQR